MPKYGILGPKDFTFEIYTFELDQSLVGSGGFWWVLVGLPFSNYENE